MEKHIIELDKSKWKETVRKAVREGGLAAVLAGRLEVDESGVDYPTKTLREAIADELGKDPFTVKNPDEFWTPAIENALAFLTDAGYAGKFRGIIALMMDGQISPSLNRRSFRSGVFSYHAEAVLYMLVRYVFEYYFEGSLEEQLFSTSDGIYWSKPYRLALELKNGNQEIIRPVRSAICEEESEIPLSRSMIEAVILSGHEELLDGLLRLLSTAGLQEGLRQQILESADMGSMKTHLRIMKCCLDENMFRFSSAVRAFDTWTGLGFGNEKAPAVSRAAAIAYEVLSDEDNIRKYVDSEDHLEAYLALWGAACREMDDADRLVEKFLTDPRTHRRVLGWYFAAHSGDAVFSMKAAFRHLDERDDEVLSWLVQNLPYRADLADNCEGLWEISLQDFPESHEERRRIFEQLKEILTHIGSRKKQFSRAPFPWARVALDSDRVIRCMMTIAGCDMDTELVEMLFNLTDRMNPYRRWALVVRFAHPENGGGHLEFICRMLGDRSDNVKDEAAQILSRCSFNEEGVKALGKALPAKSGLPRESIVSALSNQPEEVLGAAISSFLAAGSEAEIRTGIELLALFAGPKPALIAKNRVLLQALGSRRLTRQTAGLLNQLLCPKDKELPVFTKENGYGLYNPATVAAFTAALPSAVSSEDILTEAQFYASLITPEELTELFSRLDAVFERHAGYEYEILDYNGAREKVLLGDEVHWFCLPAESGCQHIVAKKARLEMIPFWDEFAEAFGGYLTDPVKYPKLFYLACTHFAFLESASLKGQAEPWFQEFIHKGLKDYISRIEKIDDRFKRHKIFYDFLEALYNRLDSHLIFRETVRMYRSCIAMLGEHNMLRACSTNEKDLPYGINIYLLSVWRNLVNWKLQLSDEEFAEWFLLEYKLESAAAFHVDGGLDTKDYFRAFDAGIIGQDVLFSFLANPYHDMPDKIHNLTDVHSASAKAFFEKFRQAREVTDRFIDRIVELEAGRSGRPTDVSSLCMHIRYFEGMRHFVRILAALGKEDLCIGNTTASKPEMLSYLLKRCHPAKDDTTGSLATMLKGTGISESRLAEAALLAPQWAGFIEQVLDWKGLKSAVLFFHAHFDTESSAGKETEVAHYSPVTLQQFKDGAFDLKWFTEAYGQLGEERFQLLRRAVRILTCDPDQRKLAQLYTDAVLGRLDAEVLRQEIEKKHVRTKMRCYALLPIEPGDEKETLHRYEVIQTFLKESKKFGSERRENDRKACSYALDDLAFSAGYADADHLMWQMESVKGDSLKPFLEPTPIGSYTVRLSIDEDGDASVLIERGGKALKSIPKELAKNEDLLRFKAAVKDISEQKRRTKESLERAMTECSEFSEAELHNLLGNSVLNPLAAKLLWVSGDHIGLLRYPQTGSKDSAGAALCLAGPAGQLIEAAGTFRPAHPHDLKQAGVWSDWMHFFFENKMVQPFKQVFREYYPITDDERSERTVSRRYAGHQVQPRRTVGLLKGRGWTVDYDEGLQKVFYKENLIVRMYAVADWFSPSDIEAPTLETVEFFSRQDGRNVPLEEIPPVLFSETMRDLDLVVSVAHAGGVDPETSLSTVEMRIAIAKELSVLLKLEHVTWTGSHARIAGKLANYSVHMGSGIVHAEGKGMIAILPVHSQARGRIFLPFADDDPKTAEIMSKIVLLSEDGRIKDPAIISQICGA